ncbi:hypothetical protein SDRG_11467 [Saprolegnia diclina VS20]|uniref:PLAC8 family protein n=1 Tax=Saprolegnia diclina (strain VS20) TaxID=1156394 RepID=T0REI4_SAPDV|nr:hypothetical protein SDRG_11467 [Saprolegnia diclina VS20]EQC30708.1 hypothetical protein SDRG_11467 [Saprolegnia diclina VS20]|eukprot:XP_008615732.1 hypothetical protein SDRG_11467 [Saprolegnia diclina VS20]
MAQELKLLNDELELLKAEFKKLQTSYVALQTVPTARLLVPTYGGDRRVGVLATELANLLTLDAEPTATYCAKEPSALEPAIQIDQNGLVRGQWKSDTFDCLDDFWPNACMSCLFPCVALAQVAHRTGFAKYGITLLTFGLVFTIYLITSCIMTGLAWSTSGPAWFYGSAWAFVNYICLAMCAICVMLVRADVRKKLSIPGSLFEDFACGLFCKCCAIAQMATQTNTYEPKVCAFGPKDTLPAFTSMA